MENDIRTGGRVVLEAHSGHQVYEESIALLPEPSMLLDLNPTQNKRQNYSVSQARFVQHGLT